MLPTTHGKPKKRDATLSTPPQIVRHFCKKQTRHVSLTPCHLSLIMSSPSLYIIHTDRAFPLPKTRPTKLLCKHQVISRNPPGLPPSQPTSDEVRVMGVVVMVALFVYESIYVWENSSVHKSNQVIAPEQVRRLLQASGVDCCALANVFTQQRSLQLLAHCAPLIVIKIQFSPLHGMVCI